MINQFFDYIGVFEGLYEFWGNEGFESFTAFYLIG